MATEKEQLELTQARLNLDALKEQLELARANKDSQDEIRNITGNILAARQRLNDLQLKGYNYSKLETEELQKKLKAMEGIASLEDEREEIRSTLFRRKKEQVEEELQALKNADILEEKKLENKQKELKYLKELEELYNDISEGQKNLGNNFTKMVAGMGVQLNDVSSSFFVSAAKSVSAFAISAMEKFSKLKDSFKNGGGGLKSFSDGFKNVAIEVGLLFTKVLKVASEQFLAKLEERFINLVKVMTEKMPEFGKATGLDTEIFKTQVDELAGVNAEYGFTVEKVTAATTELASSMSIFSKMTDTQRTAFINATMFAENFGIANQTSMRILEDLNTVLNKTGTQSETTYNYLQRAALGAGIPPSKLAKDLESALPKLAVQGNKMIEVFVGLSRQAKHLNVEVSDLLGLVDKFDTFEGAAESAGKLNAILGGDYINSLQMINATEEERVMLIRQGLQQAGLQFDSLGKYQKLAVANALGIQDMSKASKILSGSTSDLNASLMGTASTQEIYNKRAEANVKLTEKLNAAFDVMAPIAIKIAEALTAIVDLFVKLGPTGVIVGAIASFATLAFVAKKSIQMVTDVVQNRMAENVADAASKTGSAAAKAAADKAKEALEAKAKEEAEAKAKDLAGGVIDKAMPSPPEITKGAEPGSSIKSFLTNVAEGLKQLGDPAALKGAATFAIIVLSFTGAVLMLSYSIENFNKATGMGFVYMIGTMTALVISMFLLTKIMGAFATNPLTWVGIAAITAIGLAMLAMAYSVKIISDALVNLNKVTSTGLLSLSTFLLSFSSFGASGIVGSVGLYLTAKAIDTLAESLSKLKDINGDNMLKISYSVNEITNIPKLEDEKIKGVEKVLKAVSEYQVTITNAKVDTSAQTQFLEQVANVMSEAVKLINGKPVNIKIDQSGNSFSIRSPNP